MFGVWRRGQMGVLEHMISDMPSLKSALLSRDLQNNLNHNHNLSFLKDYNHGKFWSTEIQISLGYNSLMEEIAQKTNKNNYAFIDGQNLNLAIRDSGWKLDFKRFRVQDFGFNLIFKPTFRNKDGKVKGNVDAELVLQTMIEYPNYEKAVIVTGDGDFYCLVKYLKEKNKLLKVLIPNSKKYSGLLKKSAANNLAFMNELKKKLEFKESKKKRTS
jgi:uncharacterized LabA/DUF88 family protein